MKHYNTWYKMFKPNQKARIRLFCFHHSGGAASSYYPWIKHISPNIELIAIQLPGREDRFSEPLINKFEDIIFHLLEDFYIYTDKPFFVFGHSLGAIIGCEFINAIRDRYSISPHYLIVSAARAPHLTYKRTSLGHLDDASLTEKIKIYNGIEDNIINNNDLLSLFLPIIRNDFQLIENYTFNPFKPFLCDILSLAGSDDHTIKPEDIRAWSAYSLGKFHYLSFSGEHFFLKKHQLTILKIINYIGTSYSRDNNYVLKF